MIVNNDPMINIDRLSSVIIIADHNHHHHHHHDHPDHHQKHYNM